MLISDDKEPQRMARYDTQLRNDIQLAIHCKYSEYHSSVPLIEIDTLSLLRMSP